MNNLVRIFLFHITVEKSQLYNPINTFSGVIGADILHVLFGLNSFIAFNIAK